MSCSLKVAPNIHEHKTGTSLSVNLHMIHLKNNTQAAQLKGECNSPVRLQFVFNVSEVRDWRPSWRQCMQVCMLWLAVGSRHWQPAILTLSAALYWMIPRHRVITSSITATDWSINMHIAQWRLKCHKSLCNMYLCNMFGVCVTNTSALVSCSQCCQITK